MVGLGHKLKNILFIGSGALPLSSLQLALLVQREHNAEGGEWSIANMDCSQEASEWGSLVVSRVNPHFQHRIRSVSKNALTVEREDIEPFQTVFMAALVVSAMLGLMAPFGSNFRKGKDTASKVTIVTHVLSYMKPGGFLLLRY